MPSCPSQGNQGKCSGVTKGNCNCNVQCVGSTQLCPDSCKCEGTYKQCENGFYVTKQVPGK